MGFIVGIFGILLIPLGFFLRSHGILISSPAIRFHEVNFIRAILPRPERLRRRSSGPLEP